MKTISTIPSSSLIWLCILCFLINHAETTATNETDRQALLAIKNLISDDPFMALTSWNNSLHFCKWHGVTCGRKHQRVTVLNLTSLKLSGFLSPFIRNLTFLRVIDLETNNFRKTVPLEIGRLFRLEYLSLANNSFQGEFPFNLTCGSNLRYLYLMGNNFHGKIPSDLGSSFPKLYELLLENNHFTGPIPPSLGNLSALQRLSLARNNFEGSIPVELGHLSNLEYLRLSINNFSGMVPKQLYNISSISFLSLTDNQLIGRLPPDLGLSTLPNIQILYLGGNQFSGTIPTSITNASALVKIDFSENVLTGTVPKNLGLLPNLEGLAVSINLLGENEATDLTFLISLTNCSSLTTLDSFGNHFRGTLPNPITNLSNKLLWFGLGGNFITGGIPSEIGKLRNLQFLGLSKNMLTGSIPDSIGNISNLRRFYANTNKISGRIPSSFGNISLLSILNLGDNFLEGTIPVSLGNCINLQYLNLSYNHLIGVIPEQVVSLVSLSIGLDLAGNNLTGPLPLQVGNMINLNHMDVSENKLSGAIPSTVGGCVMLEFLLMEDNFFEGTIPSSLGKLRGIKVLDLSHNNLSGKIPTFLGELRVIENLNLSFNQFEGEVPTEGVFGNISAFSIARNNKLCGGIKALQLPACPKEVEKKQKHHFSHRKAIMVTSIAFFISLLLACLCAIVYRNRRSKRNSISTSSLEEKYPRVSYADLVRATDGFSSANLIGDGSFGTVYKAILRGADDQIVAVKVLKLQLRGANKTFMAECEAMRNIRHKNLVKIVTSCSTINFEGNDFKALIFEYMPKGSLESWLHPISTELQDSKNLRLVQRINIAIDVASALDYLHNHCETPVIHCDLKPSNVLLDDDLNACVSDFGLARILLATSKRSVHSQTSSIGIKGTVGYVAPEYGMGEEVSKQGDVYSYGILLLEMFTGKRPTDSMFMGDLNLHNFVKMALPEQVMENVDPSLLTQKEEGESRRSSQSISDNTKIMEECLKSILGVGVHCSADFPGERMVVRDVLAELHGIKKMLFSY